MPKGIYCITNIRNGSAYIGSTNHLKKRWREHVQDLNRNLHANINLQSAWNHFGEDAFRFSIIEEVSGQEALRTREQHWIDEYRKQGTVYNAAVVRGDGKRREVKTYSFTVDTDRDRDVAAWLERQNNRSKAIRAAIRESMAETVTLFDVYRLVREINDKLGAGAIAHDAGRAFTVVSADEPVDIAATLDGLGL